MSGNPENIKYFGRQDEDSKGPAPEDQKEEIRPPEPEGHLTSSPAFRPPAIVIETRIPNVLQDIMTLQESSSLGERQYFSTVIVVQGDDPNEVAEKIKVLRILLEVDR